MRWIKANAVQVANVRTYIIKVRSKEF